MHLFFPLPIWGGVLNYLLITVVLFAVLYLTELPFEIINAYCGVLKEVLRLNKFFDFLFYVFSNLSRQGVKTLLFRMITLLLYLYVVRKQKIIKILIIISARWYLLLLDFIYQYEKSHIYQVLKSTLWVGFDVQRNIMGYKKTLISNCWFRVKIILTLTSRAKCSI